MTELTMMPKYEKYKDSGVEWLGEIPESWKVKRFKFLASITTGEKNTEDKEDDGQYPFFVRSQTLEKISTYAFDGEAILTAGDGAGVGKVYHYINGKFDFHQRVYKFSDFSEVIGKYLYNYLYVNFFNVAILGTAKSTVDSLRLPLIQNFEVCYPECESEQEAIIHFLEQKTAQIDEAIAIKQQQIELLKERKQIIIQQAVTQGLDPNVPMKDSGVDWIGKIPEHWEVKRVKYVLEERNERSKTGEEPLFMMSQVHGLVVRADYHDKAEVAASNIDNKIVYKNDLVFNKLKAHLGVFFKSNIDFKGLVSPDYAVYKPKAFIADVKMLELLFRHPRYIEQFVIRATGIVEGLIRLYTDDLFDIAIPIAPIKEQVQILEFIDAQNGKFDIAIKLQTEQIEKLKEYKTTLINSAVTGKIKLPTAIS
ncbi:restriction endonuclease subunit S [Shewanella sp. 202IG2-18]|uniref:restriction endonuclease subunit S n=1 Tax=Parashewanella hymeniacidonis TaxID=2807618 RepID=UPI0019603F2E|nr:restriction endonuclease subunit S [Parashewanella hymeniacidonis]MBM7070669.1 restriction endonuclease subunit S [Parashewanella hymeniacidonis]